MEGSKTVISVDPWQGESPLIKPLASIYPEIEREKREKSPSSTSSPQSPKYPQGMLGLKKGEDPCGLLTSWLALLIYYPITVKYGRAIIDSWCSPLEGHRGYRATDTVV